MRETVGGTSVRETTASLSRPNGERTPGRLFVVATPIGNLGDITVRALETLRSVDLVAAEDTRHTGNLLRHFQISVRLLSYHQHNRVSRLPRLLTALQQRDVALVSDAGTPLISDPGHELVAAAAAAGHQVITIPGPSAPIAALSVSGFNDIFFHFSGFLPRRAAERRRTLKGMLGWSGTLIFFEAPHRLRATLCDLFDVLGDRSVAVCSELTKLHEEVHRGRLAAAVAHFQAVKPRGEYTIVVARATDAPVPPGDSLATAAGSTAVSVAAVRPVPTAPDVTTAPASLPGLRRRYAELVAEVGDRRRALALLAAEAELPRKWLYEQLVVLRSARETRGGAATSSS